ncbi:MULTISPECIES: DUF6431 domain-containing protein [Gracilibacillus]|uniref:DUF6431 domain-containing protein n=1 Tax=Gracilibacillus TaxID=74385 RepID=UPI000824CA71|nr:MULTISPECIES: DUF6431 domain-containing protein [Gracilibacillus]
MIFLHDFGIGIEEYEKKGKKNNFPLFKWCPNCQAIAYGNLHRHGYYWRYGINQEEELHIPICRFRCLVCQVTISILPSFLIPYFQHTLDTMMERLSSVLKGEKVKGSRQQLEQHLKRFYESIHWTHSFFTDAGYQLGFTKDIKKEAQKYVTMIQDFGESTSFFRRSWGHLSSYFMGKLILPYLPPKKNTIHPT